MLTVLKAIWRGWKRFAHALVAAQSWLLMAVVYWFALAPVAVAFRLFRPDPLDRGAADPAATTFWKPLRKPRQDLLRSQRPF